MSPTRTELVANLERAVHIIRVLRQDMHPSDPFIVGVDEFLSAFNEREFPTFARGKRFHSAEEYEQDVREHNRSKPTDA